jgi:cytochrome o ubiquinol oxidase operon protein cyoD
MTAKHYDRAPGDASRPTELRRDASFNVLVYSVGLSLAAILTAISFWAANTSLLWPPGVPLGLAALAITQMGIHLVFFLHITSGPDSTNNVLALAFGVLIVALVMAGSLWIMTNLDQNMTPMREMHAILWAPKNIEEWIAAACLLQFIDARLRLLVLHPQADYNATSRAKTDIGFGIRDGDLPEPNPRPFYFRFFIFSQNTTRQSFGHRAS